MAILLLNVASTLFMVGLIWMVQVVHYPLFNDVGDAQYVRYQQRHQTNISYIVAPVMLVELVTAVMLAWYPIGSVSKLLVYSGIGLVVLLWTSTALLQMPCHAKLAKGFDRAIYQRLVRSNWIRTIGWTARAAVVMWMLSSLLSN